MAWLAFVLAALLGALPAAGAGSAGSLAAALAGQGLESVRVTAVPGGSRVEIENRRFRNPNFALGLVAAMASRELPGRCEIILSRQSCPVLRAAFATSDFDSLAAGPLAPRDFS